MNHQNRDYDFLLNHLTITSIVLLCLVYTSMLCQPWGCVLEMSHV